MRITRPLAGEVVGHDPVGIAETDIRGASDQVRLVRAAPPPVAGATSCPARGEGPFSECREGQPAAAPGHELAPEATTRPAGAPTRRWPGTTSPRPPGRRTSRRPRRAPLT